MVVKSTVTREAFNECFVVVVVLALFLLHVKLMQ